MQSQPLIQIYSAIPQYPPYIRLLAPIPHCPHDLSLVLHRLLETGDDALYRMTNDKMEAPVKKTLHTVIYISYVGTLPTYVRLRADGDAGLASS